MSTRRHETSPAELAKYRAQHVQQATAQPFPAGVMAEMQRIAAQMQALQGERLGIIKGALIGMGIDSVSNDIQIDLAGLTYTVTPKTAAPDPAAVTQE